MSNDAEAVEFILYGPVGVDWHIIEKIVCLFYVVFVVTNQLPIKKKYVICEGVEGF